MKKILITFVMLITASVVFAQEIEFGSLEALAKEGRAGFEIDYSEAVIHNMTEAEFTQYEQDWKKDQRQIISMFLSNLNEETEDVLKVVSGLNAPLTLRWCVINIEPKGHTDSNICVVDQNGNILAKITGFYGRGGAIGSKLNLIKDGARSSGHIIGIFLKREIKRELKKANKQRKMSEQ